MPLVKEDFNREKHVYKNKKFSELLLDAVRFFHGTPVLPLPPNEPFKGAGVYAIYCIARTGIYKTFGEKINRKSYDVPIYVGLSRVDEDKKGKFGNLPIDQQLAFWRKAITTTIGMSVEDFKVRVVISHPQIDLYGIAQYLTWDFHPVWNSFVKKDMHITDVNAAWAMLHNVRFHKKMISSESTHKRQMLQFLLQRVSKGFAA